MVKGIYSSRFTLTLLIVSTFFIKCTSSDGPSVGKDIDPKLLPNKLKIIDRGMISPTVSLQVVDLNGDGASELLHINNEAEQNSGETNFVTPSDISTKKAQYQLNFEGVINVECMDINEDGSQEIFVGEQIENTLYLHIYNHKGARIKKLLVASGGPRNGRKWRCYVNPVGMMDANGDGRKDLVVRIFTTYVYQPRGIRVYDLETGEVIWDYPTGTAVSNEIIADLDNNASPEIVLGTMAPDNGNGELINGTDDSHSYLIILDARGKKLIQHELGGVFSTIYASVHDMQHDGQPEILILKKSNKSPEKNMISFWNFQDGRLFQKKEFEKQLNDYTLFFDFNNDGIDEFMAFWEDGLLEIRNHQNEVLKTYEIGETLQSTPILSDLNSDGSQEIILGSVGNLYVFSNDLKLLSKFPVGSRVVQDISSEYPPRKGLLVISDNKYLRLELERNSAAILHLTWPAALGFIIGTFASFIVIAISRYRRRNTLSTLIERQTYSHEDRGIIAVDQKGNIKLFDDRAREFLNLKNAILIDKQFEEALVDPQYKEMCSLLRKSLSGTLTSKRHNFILQINENSHELQLVINAIKDSRGRIRGSLVILEDITTLAKSRQAIAWAAMAQKLVHQIKTPLSSVMLAVQRLQMEYQRDKVAKAKDYDRYINYVSTEVRRVREVTDGVMKLARLEEPNFSLQDLNQIISNCLTKYKSKMKDSIQIQTEYAKDVPKINLDKNQLEIAFSILIENCMEAMDGNGKLTLNTRMAQSLQFSSTENSTGHIHIEIADTGVGIPPEAQERLFEPFFTTKKNGTGLGLTIVKKIIDDHEGSIEIKSDIGIGTVVLVILPVRS